MQGGTKTTRRLLRRRTMGRGRAAREDALRDTQERCVAGIAAARASSDGALAAMR